TLLFYRVGGAVAGSRRQLPRVGSVGNEKRPAIFGGALVVSIGGSRPPGLLPAEVEGGWFGAVTGGVGCRAEVGGVPVTNRRIFVGRISREGQYYRVGVCGPPIEVDDGLEYRCQVGRYWS